jgi:hypothetical protein
MAKPSPEQIVEAIAALQFRDTFNPYRDHCAMYDLPDAVAIRRANLQATFEAAAGGVDAMWIGLEPGHRGARRTGLAMTDDRNVVSYADRWGLEGIQRATHGPALPEQTAKIVWEALAGTQDRILLWNTFPLHSHQPGRPFSNRRHTREEGLTCRDLLHAVVELAAPRDILAVGAEAQRALSELGLVSQSVRHPAYGGKAEFMAGVRRAG